MSVKQRFLVQKRTGEAVVLIAQTAYQGLISPSVPTPKMEFITPKMGITFFQNMA